MTAVTTTTPSRAMTRPRPAWCRVLALAVTELRLLGRRRTVAASAIVLPLALVGLTYVGERPETAGRWGATLGVHAIIALLITVYLTTTMVLATRRQTLVFRRLLTSELSGPGVLTGVLLPVVLLGALQLVAVGVINVATGAPPPADPLLLVGATSLGLVPAVVAGVATAAFTSSAERAQFTSMPLFLAAAVGAQIVTGGFAEELVWGAYAVPLVPVADLVAKAWAGPGQGVSTLPVDVPVTTTGLALLALWTGFLLVVAARSWRWDVRG
jgi:ABC-2 type transport system permease protein